MSRNMTGITKYKRKDGKSVYRVRYSFQSKDVRLPGTFETVTEAQNARRKALAEAKRGNPANKDNMTVSRLVDIYRTLHMKNLARNTRYTRDIFFNKHILPFMGRCKISSLHKVTWLELIAHLEKKGLAPNSVRDIMQVVKALFNWAEENEVIASNPFYKSKLSKGERIKHTVLTAEDTFYLLSKARPIELVILALGTIEALRKGEMLGLWWSDIDFNDQKISIQRSWDGYEYSIKTKTSRATLSMTPLVAEVLQMWRKINTHFKYVLPGEGGLKPMSPPMPNYYLKVLLRRESFQHVTVHELRHSCGHVLAKGIHPQYVQKHMRHANIRTTIDIYGNLDEGITVQTAGRLTNIC